mmetsp:Transcript_19821/g.40971  ORF Transcript_19821/g.40971 Transcript_19821/m.40971 type:complete len:261 (+) Transcript_19821:2497-3279(+)
MIVVAHSIHVFDRCVGPLLSVVSMTPVVVDLVLAVEVVEVDVAIKYWFLRQNFGLDDLDGVRNKMVPFRVVFIGAGVVNVLHQVRASGALGADGTKAGITLFVEGVLVLTTWSVAFRVIDLVDVPIGTTGPARISDGPGNVRNFLVVIGEGQLVESQVRKFLGAFVFLDVLFLGVIGFVGVVVVIRCVGLGHLLFVLLDGFDGGGADLLLLRVVFVVVVKDIVGRINLCPIGLRTGLHYVGTIEIEVGSFQQTVVDLFQK